jgi:PIN domain nuclease of toxin-antitoxin system
MAFLLDTHTLLWFVSGDEQLPHPVRNKIKDIDQKCLLSVASLWEITIKVSLGKLELGLSLDSLFKFIDRNQIELIPISYPHLLKLANLPDHHKDPFDRLIIAQALTENLTVISKDKELEKYKAKLLRR